MSEYIVHHTITTHVEADDPDDAARKARLLDLAIIAAVQAMQLPRFVSPDILIEHTLEVQS